MSRIALSKAVLEWALRRRGLTIAKLRPKFPKIQEWVEGSSNPTLKQVETLAKLTNTPFGYFFLDTPPAETLPIPHFRTQDDKRPHGPSLELLDTIQQMQQRQDWLREYLVKHGEEPVGFVGKSSTNSSPTEIAARIRQSLKLETNWAAKHRNWSEALQALREAMEDAGILVFVNGIVGNNTHRKLAVEEFRGFVLVDTYAPLVFINGADGKAAQMFTLAHELAHVFLGSSAAFDLRDMQAASDPIEQACNKVAAEFLVPERDLRAFWPSVKGNPEPFQAVARNFKVSAIVAARRGLDIGLITRDEFYDFYKAYLNDEDRAKARASSGGDFYASQNLRVGRRFGETVARAVREGTLLYSEAYRLTGLHGASFKKFAESQGYWEPGA